MHPDDAKLLADSLLLPTLAEEHLITKRVIEAIPFEKADYRPHALARTANELARHIVVAEKRFVDAAITGEFSRFPALPSQVTTPRDLVTWYSQNFSEGITLIRGVSGEQLIKNLDFIGGEIQVVTALHFSLKHSIHHRGQLSAYLRAMGERVPSIYGQSYEDAEESKTGTR